MSVVILDTNVLVAALRSRRGAAFRVLSLVGTGVFEHCMSVALAFEYEDVLCRPDSGIRMPRAAVEDVLSFLCATARCEKIYFLWRPTLRDPKDDMILELAVQARCDTIVTYNVRDFRGSQRFGVRVLRPQQFLACIGENQ